MRLLQPASPLAHGDDLTDCAVLRCAVLCCSDATWALHYGGRHLQVSSRCVVTVTQHWLPLTSLQSALQRCLHKRPLAVKAGSWAHWPPVQQCLWASFLPAFQFHFRDLCNNILGEHVRRGSSLRLLCCLSCRQLPCRLEALWRASLHQLWRGCQGWCNRPSHCVRHTDLCGGVHHAGGLFI